MTRLTFTRGDLTTFLTGLGVFLALTFAEFLIRSDELFADPLGWFFRLLGATLTATGRYILTEMARRRLTPSQRDLLAEIEASMAKRNKAPENPTLLP